MPSLVPFPTRVDLAPDVREAVCEVLTTALACAIDLQCQAKQAHWNVKGPLFGPLHALFDAVHDTAEDVADDLAERIAQLGGTVAGTVQAVAAGTTLSEAPSMAPATGWLTQIAEGLSVCANGARASVDAALTQDDQVTANLLADIGQRLDKQLWMVDAHLTVVDGAA